MRLDVQTEVRCSTHGTTAESLMLRCSLTIEQTGRPESTRQRLPRLSNPFVKKNKPEWKVATLWDLIPELEPELEPDAKPSSVRASLSRSSKPLPPLPLA